MSEWYADTVATVRGDVVTDPDQHAAQERLECYRLHGAEIPPGGGEPAMPPRREPVRRASAASRPRSAGTPRSPRATGTTGTTGTTRRAAAPRKPEPAPAPLCPTCFMVLPSTGVCDNCD